MKARRLLAIDPSLTCSGWALFTIEDGSLLGVGKIRAPGPRTPMAIRLQDVHRKIEAAFKAIQFCANDVLICEAPTTMRDPRAAFKVEQVRGIFEGIARAHGACVPGRINPRSVQYEVMGLRGKQLSRAIVKETAAEVVYRAYGNSLERIGFNVERRELFRHQDIIDAILLGSLGLTWIQSAERGGFQLEEFFDQGTRSRRSMVG